MDNKENKTEFQMLAKTFKSLEGILAQEIINLGGKDVKIERRAVSFRGDKELLYKANLHLRTASRVLKPIANFKIKSTDDFYDKVKSINWSELMNSNATFSIDSTVYSDIFTHSKFITYRAKDAIVDYFVERENKRPNVSITNPQFVYNVHIAQDEVTISLDSSGESLHKRGYRAKDTEAPLNEALAAGMILLTDWRGQKDFIDPMCGSGTLLIEAALIALNIPPGIFRGSFAFEKWKDFDDDLFQTLYQDDSNEKDFNHKIYGYDISPSAVQIAIQNVKSAGLSKYIEISKSSIQELNPETKNATLVCNPPYGERIVSDDIFKLYQAMGTFIKHKMTGNKAWVISSNFDAMRNIGLKPSQKIELMNGALDCLFCEYEVFEGKRKEFVINKKQHNHSKNHRNSKR